MEFYTYLILFSAVVVDPSSLRGIVYFKFSFGYRDYNHIISCNGLTI